MAKFIALSGASHSGKTTFLKEAKKYLESLGNYKVLTADEHTRSEKIDIDNIRKDPEKHFKFQKEACYNKICEEISLFSHYEKENDKTIVIFDRSLADSYFYLTNYQDKHNLSADSKIEYYKFEKYVRDRMLEHIKNVYTYVFLFEPIKPKYIPENGFRTVDLNLIQDYEYFMIQNLLFSLYYDDNETLMCGSVERNAFAHFINFMK